MGIVRLVADVGWCVLPVCLVMLQALTAEHVASLKEILRVEPADRSPHQHSDLVWLLHTVMGVPRDLAAAHIKVRARASSSAPNTQP